VARHAPTGDPRSVPWRGPSRGASDGSDTRVALQCGGCDAWRARDLGPRAVRVLDRRLCRDIENMERLLLDEALISQTYSIKP
jgi:hypothetical protein